MNRILNERRGARRQRAAYERLALARVRTVDADVRLDIERAIDALPRQQRIALALFYVGGLSSSEIGAAMGITAGTVRSHLHDARMRLRDRLDVRDV